MIRGPLRGAEPGIPVSEAEVKSFVYNGAAVAVGTYPDPEGGWEISILNGSWSVAQTFSENYALPGLERLGFDKLRGPADVVDRPVFYRPMCRTRRGFHEPVGPLFPNYLFIFGDLGLWSKIAEVFGVARVLKSDDERPAVISEIEIGKLRSYEGPDGVIDLRGKEPGRAWFVPGQGVRPTRGAFFGLPGVFDCYCENDRVKVLLNIFGRKVPTTLLEDDLEIDQTQVRNERSINRRARRKRQPSEGGTLSTALAAL